MRGLGHSVHSASKSQLVRFGGPGEAAQLSDELERRCADLFARGRWFEVVQGFDVSTHEGSSHTQIPPSWSFVFTLSHNRSACSRSRQGITIFPRRSCRSGRSSSLPWPSRFETGQGSWGFCTAACCVSDSSNAWAFGCWREAAPRSG